MIYIQHIEAIRSSESNISRFIMQSVNLCLNWWCGLLGLYENAEVMEEKLLVCAYKALHVHQKMKGKCTMRWCYHKDKSWLYEYKPWVKHPWSWAFSCSTLEGHNRVGGAPIRNQLCGIGSSGMWLRSVWYIGTDVSEELGASVVKHVRKWSVLSSGI
jgi:hypothetical protein